MNMILANIAQTWTLLSQHKLFKTGVYTAFLKISSQFVVLASGILVARYLGPDSYGVYAFAMALVGAFILVSQLGFTTYSVKLISTYESSQDWLGLRSYIIYALSFVLVGSIVITFLCYLYFSNFSAQNNIDVILVALILIPISALFRVLQSFMNGFQFVKQSETIVLIRQTVFLVVCGFILIVGFASFTPSAVLYIQGISTAIAVVILIVYIQKKSPEPLRQTTGYEHSRAWLPGALSFIMLSMMNYINTQTDTLMLGIMRESSEVAFYRVASQAAMLIGFASQITILLIAPKIAKLYHSGRTKELQSLITGSTQVMFVFALAVALFLVVFSSSLISILFGEAYLDAKHPLFILCIGKVVLSIFGCTAIVLNMCGYEKSTTKILVISSLLNVLLNFILVPSYGAYGAALATTLVVSLSSILMFYKIKKSTGLTAFVFSNK